MTKLTKDQVKKIARLCRIKLTPEEIDKFTSQLTSILDYVQKINEVDTGKITFKKGKYFAIPKILETET